MCVDRSGDSQLSLFFERWEEPARRPRALVPFSAAGDGFPHGDVLDGLPPRLQFNERGLSKTTDVDQYEEVIIHPGETETAGWSAQHVGLQSHIGC